MNTLTQAEFKKKYGEVGVEQLEALSSETSPNYFQRVRNSMQADNAMRQNTYAGIFNRTKDAVEKAQNPIQGIGSIVKGVGQTLGQVAGGGANAIESTISEIPGVNVALSALGNISNKGSDFIMNSKLPGMNNPVINPTRYLANKLSDSKSVQNLSLKYEQDPDFKATLDALANTVRLALDIKGATDMATFVGEKARTFLGKNTPKPLPPPQNTTKEFKPTLVDESKPTTVVNTHVNSAKMIAQDAIDNQYTIPTDKLLMDTQKEILAGLSKNVPGYKEAAAAISKIDPSIYSTIDDYGRAVNEVLKVQTKVTPVVTKTPLTLKEAAANQQLRQASVKGGISTTLPGQSSITDSFGKNAMSTASVKSTNPVADLGLAERASARSAILSDIIPSTKSFSADEITKALDLTQGDVKNIFLSTKQKVGNFLIDNNLVGETVADTATKLDVFYKDNYLKVRDEISKVKNVYNADDVPQYKVSLEQVQNQIKNVPGLEKDAQNVAVLLGKKQVKLSDVQAAKELLDKYFSLYKATGDVKEGTTKLGLTKIRGEVQKFIEDEVKTTTGADIKQLNNNVSASRSIKDAVETRSTRDSTRATVTAGDIAVFLSGSAVGTPLGGVAAVILKKLYQSPTAKLKFIKYINKLSNSERKDFLTALQNNEVPKGLKLSQFSKVSSQSNT